MVSIPDALGIILERVPVRRTVDVPLAGAYGHVLAVGAVSDVDMPPFPKSAMDGFALRSSDVASAPARLRVVGTIAAGQVAVHPVGPGEAMKIMTGAPVPAGADAVQMVERTRSSGDDVEILESVTAGENVARQAEDLRRGDVALPAGTYVGGAEIGILASIGAATVTVYRAPAVSVLSTGDELCPVDGTPAAGQIRNSNGPTLAAMSRAERCSVVELGIARDERCALRELISRGLESDVLLVTGGVSMGEHDLVDGMLRELGVELHFESVKIKPGKPMVFGTSRSGTMVFGLPGNPLSSMVNFMLFVAPAIRTIRGLPKVEAARARARLTGRAKGDRRRPTYARAILTLAADGFTCEPVAWHGSADLPAFCRGNGLLEVPEGVAALEAGDTATVLFEETFLWR
ncbi:MAG: gephyrin-like molybdotransferase Glp [Acidobacteriota bacterium]